MLLSGVFQGANRGCSYCNYPSRLRASLFDLSGGLGERSNTSPSANDVFRLARCGWLERAESDMESDFGGLNASLGKLGDSFGVKWSPAVGAATEPVSRANTVW